MRIGDAERTEIADRLARHFSDGRLDEAEFGDRLDRAMRAKTKADLSGLLADLPPDSVTAPQGGRRHQRKMAQTELDHERLALKAEQQARRRAGRQRRRHSVRMLVLFVGLVIGALALANWMAHSVAVWIVVAVIAFVWVRRNAARSRPGR
jgi:Flp pilus assembly protein TadB